MPGERGPDAVQCARQHQGGGFRLFRAHHHARQAARAGAAAIDVFNHRGRQADGAIGALEALPGIVDSVGDELEVLFDSGIRGGADVLKAVALGARATLFGRPLLWALAAGGEAVVQTWLRSLLAHLDLTLAVSGYDDDGLERRALVRAG